MSDWDGEWKLTFKELVQIRQQIISYLLLWFQAIEIMDGFICLSFEISVSEIPAVTF